jgi:hypothetical protein
LDAQGREPLSGGALAVEPPPGSVLGRDPPFDATLGFGQLVPAVAGSMHVPSNKQQICPAAQVAPPQIAGSGVGSGQSLATRLGATQFPVLRQHCCP